MAAKDCVVHIDTPDVRVVRWRLNPNESTDPAQHPCDVVLIPLTDGQLRSVVAQGPSFIKMTTGESVLCAAPVNQGLVNRGDSSVAFVQIELKHSAQRLISA